MRSKARCDMPKALDVAKYIVNESTQNNYQISNLKLQKILFFLQREFLKHDKEAFEDDIEAWQFGSVIPVVYQEFCMFGANPILWSYPGVTLPYDESQKICFDEIFSKYRTWNVWDLVYETHKKGGAWDITYQDGIGNHRVIEKSLIKDKG